jgi:hypothetical protein
MSRINNFCLMFKKMYLRENKILTICLLCQLGPGGMAGLRLARLVDGNDPELVLLPPLQLLQGDPGRGRVHHLPGLPP